MTTGTGRYDDPDASTELSAYTLSRADGRFIHQHVVDAYRAQVHRPADKAIGLVQALVGLHLHVDHGYDGRQVQRVHKLLADRRPTWPLLELPAERGPMTAREVLAHAPGPERDAAIERWAASTWEALSAQRVTIVALLRAHDLEPPGSTA
ncbi:MAG TPA: DUF5946 family protein [Candidatus Limnocylindria bacterium]|nr:DUF5946 family protein [Candidatus Limnocylindria bacterium]